MFIAVVERKKVVGRGSAGDMHPLLQSPLRDRLASNGPVGDGVDDPPGTRGKQRAQRNPNAAADLARDRLEKVVENVESHHMADPRLEGGRADHQAAAQRDSNGGNIIESVVVEDGAHRLLPLGDHREAEVLECAALARTLEHDDAPARVDHAGDHRQELFDVAVESAEHDDRGADLAVRSQVVGRHRAGAERDESGVTP